MKMQKFTAVGSIDDVLEIGPFQVLPFVDHDKLKEIMAKWQKENQIFTDHIFGKIWKHDPFVDIVLLDSFGKVKSYWSTLPNGPKNGPPTLEDLGSHIAQEREMFYVATPSKSRFIFYPAGQEEILQSIHKKATKSEFESAVYVDQGPILINRATLGGGRKNHLGIAALGKVGMVQGNLGYWDNSVRNPEFSIGFGSSLLEKFGDAESYIPRVEIDRHPAGRTYITPLSPLKEAELLDRKLKLDTNRRRITAEGPSSDFILNVFFAYATNAEVNSYPLVLRHSTPKPWK